MIAVNLPETKQEMREERLKGEINAVQSLVAKICPGQEGEPVQLEDPVRRGQNWPMAAGSG